MPEKHHLYGGSTIGRTIACPGWAKLSQTLPPQEGRASDAAERGTALHEAMEDIIRDDLPVRQLEGAFFGNDYEITEADVDSLEEAKRAVRFLCKEFALVVKSIEPFVEIIPGKAGGSIDLLLKSMDGKTVCVLDYKFGHMPVSPENNPQLLFYALCADADPATQKEFKDAENVMLAVVQPEHPEETLGIWTTAIEALDDFEDKVAKAIGEAESETPTFKAGDHCGYCPAYAICPIKTGEAQEAMKFPKPVVEELERYMPHLNDLEKWIGEVRKLAQKHMEAGGKVEGFKLVNKRPTRMWTDPEKVEKMIIKGLPKPDKYETKLKSPAQMEKTLKQKGVDPDIIADYIASVSSGLTIAPESDNREAALPPEALKRLKDRF